MKKFLTALLAVAMMLTALAPVALAEDRVTWPDPPGKDAHAVCGLLVAAL